MIGSLLVYGTLRPNESAPVVVKGYKMHDLGWYPGIIRTDQTSDTILCERIKVKDEGHLAALDSYEGCNGNTPECLYHRVNLNEDQQHLDPLWIYVYNGHPDNRPVVQGGDWLSHKGEMKGLNSQLTESV